MGGNASAKPRVENIAADGFWQLWDVGLALARRVFCRACWTGVKRGCASGGTPAKRRCGGRGLQGQGRSSSGDIGQVPLPGAQRVGRRASSVKIGQRGFIRVRQLRIGVQGEGGRFAPFCNSRTSI